MRRSSPRAPAATRATTRAPRPTRLIAATNTTNTNLDSYQNYIAKQLPVIWEPNADYELSEVKNTLRGVAPQNPFANLFPEYWYYVKKLARQPI